MTNQSSIKYISSLLDSPHTISEGDKGSIGTFVQTYPYFIPVRYLTALDAHKKAPFSDDMLTSAEPYIGNWILFCDFLDAGISGQKTWRSEHVRVEAEPAIAYVYEAPEDILISEPVVVEPGSADYKPDEPAIAETTVETPYNAAVEMNEIPEFAATTESPVPDFTEAALVEEFIFNRDITAEEPAYTETTVETTIEEEIFYTEPAGAEPEYTAFQADIAEPLVLPADTVDYFQRQGERLSEEIPEGIDELKVAVTEADFAEVTTGKDKNLMVVMSFSEWLSHFKNTAEKQEEETKDRKALRTMWQKEKLAAALEEENDEIPENVFEMAVNSITSEDGLVSETLADLYIKQGKYDKAIEMYRKLSLRNPQKNTYFARKIEEVLKDKQS